MPWYIKIKTVTVRKILVLLHFPLQIFFLVLLGFELRALCLVGRYLSHTSLPCPLFFEWRTTHLHFTLSTTNYLSGLWVTTIIILSILYAIATQYCSQMSTHIVIKTQIKKKIPHSIQVSITYFLKETEKWNIKGKEWILA
jgi:hypothetical protein